MREYIDTMHSMAFNQLCHVEYQVSDLDKAQAFYAGVFGWTFRSFMENMVVFGVGDTHVGGLMKVDEVKIGESPSLWFQVESLERSRSLAVQFGGRADDEVQPVPGVGHSTVIRDPDGNLVGIVEYVA